VLSQTRLVKHTHCTVVIVGDKDVPDPLIYCYRTWAPGNGHGVEDTSALGIQHAHPADAHGIGALVCRTHVDDKDRRPPRRDAGCSALGIAPAGRGQGLEAAIDELRG
jgi:hypothetical protein